MNEKNNQLKIFVGVSGGVDSSVALALLKSQGHDVTGVFMRTWQPDWIDCTWRDERRDAMRVCAHLDVPFVELDLEKEYKEGVADYMIREYKKGKTPNPDVMCNREVKFGGFLTWAREHGADYVATGHYVDTKLDEETGMVSMLRGNDPKKDQSYFLWTLTQDQLAQIMFPVGNMPKEKVRRFAEKYQLPTASKKDSQGICFIGDIDMKKFLLHYIDESPGDVLDNKGRIIGRHTGSLFYTIGERHGFTINKEHKGTLDQPYYVIAKDLQANTITVSQEPKADTQVSSLVTLNDVVDNQEIFSDGFECEAQIRYRGEVKKVVIKSYNKNEASLVVRFKEPDPTLASGQSVVFYRGRECLGGGIVA